MVTTGNTDQDWVEIIAPAAPPSLLDAGLVWLAAVVCLLLLVGLLVAYRRPRLRAARGLRRLARALKHNAVEPRRAGFRLEAELRRALAVPRLEQHAVGASRHDDWQVFRQRLNRLCFAAEPPTAIDVQAAIDEALDWMRAA
jgi:hypothetical protein